MKIYFAAAALAALAPSLAHAHTVYVGNCNPNATILPTITAAIAAVGVNGTVDICPGTYPEQLTITKNVKLVGVNPGPSNSSLVLITPPAGGAMTNNAPDLDGGGATAAQIAVIGATVSISNVTVDAAGNTVGANNGCGEDIVGIIYQNASGTLNNNVVRNDYLAPFGTLGGCQGGLGIYVQSSAGSNNVVIKNNVVENYQKNGITANDAGSNVTITGNTVLGMGPTDGAAENSVQVGFGATGSVMSNVVGDDIWAPDTFGDTGDAAAGILVFNSAGITVSGNTVHSTQYGIVAEGFDGDADNAKITGNTVSDTYLYDAIDICGASSATVTGNKLNASDEAAVHLDSTCPVDSTGNTVSNNTINDACAGVMTGSGSGGTIGTVTGTNVANLTLTGTDVCQLPPPPNARNGHRHAQHHVRPFR